MEVLEAKMFLIHMKAKLPDKDLLFTEFQFQTESVYLSYLEELDHDEAREVARYFKTVDRFPPIVEFENKRLEMFPNSVSHAPVVTSGGTAKAHLHAARTLLNKTT